jgi:hypothetical protein
MTSLLTKIKTLDTKISTNTQNISNKQNILTPGTNITIDSNNIISSSGGGSITQAQLDEKENKLTSTSNITTGTISSGKITGRDLAVLDFPTIYGTVIQANTLIYGTSTNVALEISGLYSSVSNKQTSLGANINIITGTISSSNITGRTGTTITAPTITASSNLLYGTTNVGTKISSIETSLNTKQPTLSLTTNIITGTISSGNITGRTSTTITAPTITASSNLLYGTTNVGTKIAELETNKQNTLTTTTDLTLRDFTCNSITSGGVNLNTSLNSKQNTLTAGDNITITNNIISSTSDVTQDDLDLKQEKLSRNSHLNINSFIVSSDTSSIGTVVPGQISCNTLLIDGVDIDTKIANSTGSTITQADLDEKQNFLTSSINIETKRIDVSDKLVITGTQPSLYFKDTNARSGMIHMNDNKMYFLSGGTNTETWTQVGGEWPLTLNTNNNLAEFGGTITTPSYTFSSGKPRFRMFRNDFTLPSGTTSLLNGGTIDFQSNVTLSSGIFIANITGVYCVTCKLRMPDLSNQSVEIQWYIQSKGGVQVAHEGMEMWIPGGISGRRAGMSTCLVNLSGGAGILPRNDSVTLAGCTATFEGFLVQ